MRGLALVLVPLGAVVMSAACSDETIVLAEVPAVDAGDGRPDHASHHRCLTTADCEDGSFCDRHDCGDPAGTCEPYPVACGGEEDPVCGCDGITYWNDCLRHAAGVAGSTKGECTNGISCDDDGQGCPGSAACARLVGFGDSGGPCGPRGGGRCWILPATCPAPTTADRWNECAPPDHALHCKDTCTAIRSGRRFTRAPVCE